MIDLISEEREPVHCTTHSVHTLAINALKTSLRTLVALITVLVCERRTFADGKRAENSNVPSEPVTTRNVHPDQNPNLSGDDIPF